MVKSGVGERRSGPRLYIWLRLSGMLTTVGCAPMTMLTALLGGVLAPNAGFCEITLPTWFGSFVDWVCGLGASVRPALARAFCASVWLMSRRPGWVPEPGVAARR